MQFRGFLDYRSIRLASSSPARIISVVACHMRMAMDDKVWDPTDIKEVLDGFDTTEDTALSDLRQLAELKRIVHP
jgi:hypothetical protein